VPCYYFHDEYNSGKQQLPNSASFFAKVYKRLKEMGRV
jgi:hypothetical protein